MAAIVSRPIFVIGAPRSGTTWVQRLLLTCPGLCGGQETHFFSAFASVLWAYDRSLQLGRNVGLPAFWDQKDLVEETRELWRKTVQPLILNCPQAKVLIEKTPDHAIVLPEIFRCLPDSRVIHVIRDSRAVVASMLAASNDWGRVWAPKSARDASVLWYRCTREPMTFAKSLPANRYVQVFYEDLLTDGCAQARRLFEFAGVDMAPEQIRAAVAEQSFETQKKSKGSPIPTVKANHDAAEPAGFFRKGRVDSWRSELSLAQKLIVWRYTRKLMKEVGYDWSGRVPSRALQ